MDVTESVFPLAVGRVEWWGGEGGSQHTSVTSTFDSDCVPDPAMFRIRIQYLL